MTTAQLFFSLSCGLALLALGAALAGSGITDWGLFCAGAIVFSLTVAYHLRESGLVARMRLALAAPAETASGLGN